MLIQQTLRLWFISSACQGDGREFRVSGIFDDLVDHFQGKCLDSILVSVESEQL